MLCFRVLNSVFHGHHELLGQVADDNGILRVYCGVVDCVGVVGTIAVNLSFAIACPVFTVLLFDHGYDKFNSYCLVIEQHVWVELIL